MSGYLRVEVTQEDIDKGTRGNPAYCPIALALARQTGDWWAVFCDGAVSSPFLPRALSTRATTFVKRFDAGQPVKPFTFRLPL